MKSLTFEPRPMDELEQVTPSRTSEWLWQGYLARGNITLLTSRWKAGKTTLTAGLLRSLGTGGAFWARTAGCQGPCGLRGAARHTGRLANGQFPSAQHVKLVSRPFLERPSPDDWLELAVNVGHERQRGELDVLVVDPLATFPPRSIRQRRGHPDRHAQPPTPAGGVGRRRDDLAPSPEGERGGGKPGSGKRRSFSGLWTSFWRLTGPACSPATPTAGSWLSCRDTRMLPRPWSLSGRRGPPTSASCRTFTRPDTWRTGKRLSRSSRGITLLQLTRNCSKTGLQINPAPPSTALRVADASGRRESRRAGRHWNAVSTLPLPAQEVRRCSAGD